jgi:hypothetical protein
MWPSERPSAFNSTKIDLTHGRERVGLFFINVIAFDG